MVGDMRRKRRRRRMRMVKSRESGARQSKLRPCRMNQTCVRERYRSRHRRKKALDCLRLP